MKNEWIVIEVTIGGEFVDLLGELLAEQGCSGTVVDEKKLDTFTVPDDDLTPDSFYTVKAYFDAGSDPQLLLAALKGSITTTPILRDLDIGVVLGDTVRNEDWANGWKQNFSPLSIGDKLIICPSWEVCSPQKGEKIIEIDPGMAFGTGTHGTTQLCLEIVSELLAGDTPPRSMLDVGTGSGILALGAAALGCRQIVAIDIDDVACRVAADNVEKNGFTEQIEVSSRSLDALPGRFELIVANIMAEENIRLKQLFMDHLKDGGSLVLSGILREKEQLVCDSFAELPLVLLDSRYQDEWVCLVFRGK
jgi:ribosomal protein L11 methyltransferase